MPGEGSGFLVLVARGLGLQNGGEKGPPSQGEGFFRERRVGEE